MRSRKRTRVHAASLRLRRRSTRKARLGWLTLAALLAVAAAAGVAYATGALATQSNDVWVACVKNENGQVRIVDDESQCLASEHAISLAKPTTPPGPQNVTVDCGAGESIQQAIDQADPAERLTVTVNGICTESVTIQRDGVTLQGAGSGAGVQAPAGASALLLSGGDNLFVRALTLVADQTASVLFVSNGAAVWVDGVDIRGGADGVAANSSSFVGLSLGSTITDSRFDGVDVSGSANAFITGGTVVTGVGSTDVSDGVTSHNGGSILIGKATIENTHGIGAFAFFGGSIETSNESVIRNNDRTGLATNSGSIIANGALITGNHQGGISARGGDVVVQDGAVVEANENNGIDLGAGATLQLGSPATIRNNAGNGVALHDTSVAWGSNATISGNGGWGIFCAPDPAVAMISTGSTFTYSGNANGDTNCPEG